MGEELKSHFFQEKFPGAKYVFLQGIFGKSGVWER
jgi:hypothetical protein